VRERIRIVGVAAALAILMSTASSGRSASRSAPGSPAVARVTASRPSTGPAVTVDVVGDSLVTQSAAELSDRLVAAGFASTVVNMPKQDLGSRFVQDELAAVRARPPADVLVLATAANDALRDHDRAASGGAGAAAATFADLVDRAVGGFADRCVVVVNAREDTAPVYHPDSARAVNALLFQARDRHPNLVIVDWAAVSRLLPGDWFALDQLHFGPDPAAAAEGSRSAREYATAIVDGVRLCARPEAGLPGPGTHHPAP
jgi:hypothetical protein